jgi:hypothetical protein
MANGGSMNRCTGLIAFILSLAGAVGFYGWWAFPFPSIHRLFSRAPCPDYVTRSVYREGMRRTRNLEYREREKRNNKQARRSHCSFTFFPSSLQLLVRFRPLLLTYTQAHTHTRTYTLSASMNHRRHSCKPNALSFQHTPPPTHAPTPTHPHIIGAADCGHGG